MHGHARYCAVENTLWPKTPNSIPPATTRFYSMLVRCSLWQALRWGDRGQSILAGLPQIMSRLHLKSHIGGGVGYPLFKPQSQIGRYWRMAVDNARQLNSGHTELRSKRSNARFLTEIQHANASLRCRPVSALSKNGLNNS